MNELTNFIRQALLYLLNIATTHYDRLIPVRYYTAEVLLGSELALQYYYLSRKSATYAESFYNFKRSKLTSSGGIKPLNSRKRDIFLCLLFETILPYVKNKIATLA